MSLLLSGDGSINGKLLVDSSLSKLDLGIVIKLDLSNSIVIPMSFIKDNNQKLTYNINKNLNFKAIHKTNQSFVFKVIN